MLYSMGSCHETSPAEIYTRESETAIIFEARARNDGFEIQDGPVKRDFCAKISTTDGLSRTFTRLGKQMQLPVILSPVSRMYLCIYITHAIYNLILEPPIVSH